ncbi:MAG: IS66 family transposase [Oligoflexales bacterium]
MQENIDTSEFESLSKEQLINRIIGLQADVASLQYILFSRRSEKRKVDPEGMQPLFDEVEQIDLEESEPCKEDNVECKEKPRKKGSGRKPLPANLPRERREHDLSEEAKQCPVHNIALTRIGEKVREELEIIPAKVKVIEHVTFSYKCSCCSDIDATTKIVCSNLEPRPIPKSFASPSLLAYIATAKYCDHLPLYRQEQIFTRYSIDLKRNTMSSWMIQSSKLATPLINLMREQLLNSKVAGCDETPIQVLKEPNRKAEQRSYMWVGTSMCGPPVVIFNYDSRRNTEAAKNFLEGFEGILVCDGLKTYDSFARKENVTLAGCLVHIRRGFVKAEKALKKANPKAKTKAEIPLDLISSLYKVEKENIGKTYDEKLKKRREESQTLMNQLYSWLTAEKPKTLPKSLIGKAIRYALDQWDKMQHFLLDPHVPLDNNRAERAIRPFVIGRSNWVFSNSCAGAEASATLYSLIESAKVNGLDPFNYLCIIFKELCKAEYLEDYERLLPYNIRAHFDVKPLINPK